MSGAASDSAQGRGTLLVVSGPSGSGKSTINARLRQHPDVDFSISATTRSPRKGEVDGEHYHFLSVDDFERRRDAGEFLEHAEVHGNHYGTLRAPVDAALAAGRVFLLEIDVQGAAQLREAGVEARYLFIDVPSLEELRRRLEQRGTDSEEVIARRLAGAERERSARDRYDHVIVNDELERAYAEVLALAGLEAAPAD
ncbi:MAG: guanylate kinase [Planctomycetota bacterium]